jgi:hypothetical protein
MKVLNPVAGRTTWLFEVADLNPKGKNIFPELVDWLKDNYHFSESPDPTSKPKPEDNQGIVFKNGEFQAREEVFVKVDLTLFSDGLVANSSSSTEDTEKFLQSVMAEVVADFSLTFDPSMIRRKLFLSELNVRLDYPLQNLNPKLAPLAKRITETTGYAASPFELGGLSFWTDSTFAVTKTPPFMIERKVNAPFSENRFYTKAPVQTQEHIDLLEELEGLLRP